MSLQFYLFSLQSKEHCGAKRMQYKGKTIFCNENKEAKIPPKIPLKEVIKYYCNYPKDAKPRCKIPFIDSDFKAIKDTPHIAWLGHSSLFFTYKDIAILVDPLFSMYASPFAYINRAFPQTKCYKSNDFPSSLLVIITHAHFDHLDKPSVLALDAQTTYFICPLQVGVYLRKWGIKASKIIELDWWQGVSFDSCDMQESILSETNERLRHLESNLIYAESRTQNYKHLQSSILNNDKDSKDVETNTPLTTRNHQTSINKQNVILKITATPAQHNSARLGDFNKTLWASFVVEFLPDTPQHKKVFLSGDGGYYTHFKRIGDMFHNFDLACLESGQFNHAWRFSHSFPHEILQEAKDLNAKMVLPIHWARFVAGSHKWNEVIKFLHKNLHDLNIPCVMPQIGELYPIGMTYNNQIWWE
ncbi:MBL fold metallo-hydrolase [Helicobacter trogontum]|uniref:Zn-dependent hydrolase n=1 Tax=Helicobacter trogontum TaxID=50960 RepID=A0A4U8SBB7_9HELI|nr:MBL fold metallo-hydrolase [Helicobacter trogontum]TLD83350.1 Zn-dependent hydrolase [Helicobacter trogontum]